MNSTNFDLKQTAKILNPAVAVPHHIWMRPPRMDTAQLSLVRQPFDNPDFLFELKHSVTAR
jgi:hypothetical protein